MKSLTWVVVCLLFAFGTAVSAQNSNMSSKGTNKSGTNSSGRHGPVFRATTDQIKQAQGILKQRNFYGGEQTGKLDDPTRTGLKQYQQAESLKVTGTLNKATLEKMGIALTDQQRSM